jgi:hypothetical protein
MHATLARMRQRIDAPPAGDAATFLVLDDDRVVAEALPDQAPSDRSTAAEAEEPPAPQTDPEECARLS